MKFTPQPAHKQHAYASGKIHFFYISSLPIEFTSRAFFETKFTPHLCGILYIHHSKYTHLRKDFLLKSL
jgi:hypothetical protein